MRAQSTTRRRRAVVLLSGGLDSTTTLAIALAEGYEAHALTIRYGQRHEREIEAARLVAERLGATSHREIAIDLAAIGGSALTADIPVPHDGEPERREGEIPVTYVPARNTVLLSIALAWAEVQDAEDIFIGVNAVDYSGYPDCRPEFIEAFERLAQVATRAAVGGRALRIRAPLLDLSKAQIVKRGLELGVDFGLTSSCYEPDAGGAACGTCDACVLRRRGFEAAGVPDPTRYAPAAGGRTAPP